MRYLRVRLYALIYVFALSVRITLPMEDIVGGGLPNQTQSEVIDLKTTTSQHQGANSLPKLTTFVRNSDFEIPESFKVGFYFFIGLSAIAMLCALLKIYRMRLSRAERKYGVHSDRTTQELTPLPAAIEDDSDNDDHTLFDINRQVRHS